MCSHNYFDNAATTRPLDITLPDLCEWANPMSLHNSGVKSANLLRQARHTIANAIDVGAKSIVFTSGGTEGTNLVFYNGSWDKIYTTLFEHEASYLCALRSGCCVFLPGNHEGLDDVQQLDKMEFTRENRVLLSVLLANNETGNVYSWNDVLRMKKRLEQFHSKVYLHVDAVQAVGRLDITIPSFVDFASFSSHKFHGPHGCGFLFCRHPTELQRDCLLLGGGQEQQIRPGTHNVVGALATAHVLHYMQCIDRESRVAYMLNLKSIFLSALAPFAADGVAKILTTDSGLCNMLALCVRSGDKIKMQQTFARHNVCIGVGSACSSGKQSRVLVQMGVSDIYARGYVRFSWSHLTQVDECKLAVSVLIDFLRTARVSA